MVKIAKNAIEYLITMGPSTRISGPRQIVNWGLALGSLGLIGAAVGSEEFRAKGYGIYEQGQQFVLKAATEHPITRDRFMATVTGKDMRDRAEALNKVTELRHKTLQEYLHKPSIAKKFEELFGINNLGQLNLHLIYMQKPIADNGIKDSAAESYARTAVAEDLSPQGQTLYTILSLVDNHNGKKIKKDHLIKVIDLRKTELSAEDPTGKLEVIKLMEEKLKAITTEDLDPLILLEDDNKDPQDINNLLNTNPKYFEGLNRKTTVLGELLDRVVIYR